MTAWLSVAWCQTAKSKPAEDPNVFQPPPFFGKVPAIRKDKAGASAGTGLAGPTAPVPPPATPPVVTPPVAAPPVAPPAQPAAPPAGPRSVQPWPAKVLAARVDKAIRAGLDYLYAAQKPDGTWDTKYASQHPGGVESLVLLAAIEAGKTSNARSSQRPLRTSTSSRPRPPMSGQSGRWSTR